MCRYTTVGEKANRRVGQFGFASSSTVDIVSAVVVAVAVQSSWVIVGQLVGEKRRGSNCNCSSSSRVIEIAYLYCVT